MKYILEFQNGGKVANAGSKAPADVSDILSSAGFQRLYVETAGKNRLISILRIPYDAIRLFARIKRKSFLVVQYPIYSKKGKLIFSLINKPLRIKKVKNIAIIHDIEFARTNIKKEREVSKLNGYDVLISHSKRMSSFLCDNGVITPCYELGLFDYLVNQPNIIEREYSFDVSFAGNLKKSTFIDKLDKITKDSDVRFFLYGFPELINLQDNINYMGSFSPDDLSNIQGSWGLVWDGPSINDNVGVDGEYQKMNSPHKASMYIAAGLPVICCSSSAIADIVVGNGLGLAVDSLTSMRTAIAAISDEQYKEIVSKVKNYAETITNGKNIISVIETIYSSYRTC